MCRDPPQRTLEAVQTNTLSPIARHTTRRLGHETTRCAAGLERLAPDALDALRRLVDEHGVVFVRGFGCDPDELARVARHFGELRRHPVYELVGSASEISTIVDDADRPPAGFPWHTDLSWMVDPPRHGFLQAVEIPESGGDTLWADLVGVHDVLSPEERAAVEDLVGIHDIDDSFAASVRANHGSEVAEALMREHPPVRRRLRGTHHTTGAPLVALCPMYLRVLDQVTPRRSAELLARLALHLDDPSVSIRWTWSVGDLVVWDESSTNHKALTDHGLRRRVMRRCVAGHARTPSA